MLSRYLLIGLCLAGTATTLAAPPSSVWTPPKRTVRLDSATLEQLRATNPKFYARVERVLASADQLCKPGEPKLLQLDAKDIGCGQLLFATYPPQRELTFELDDTRYIATVFMKGDWKLTPAKPVPVRPSTAAVAAQGSTPAR
jgi:hypothetical protein